MTRAELEACGYDFDVCIYCVYVGALASRIGPFGMSEYYEAVLNEGWRFPRPLHEVEKLACDSATAHYVAQRLGGSDAQGA